MSNNGSTLYNNLFSSVISEIKSYNGSDPLLPWLRGIRKMKETLPQQILKEKLPRFLQKCSETFINDRRYSNDLRYLLVWLQLMDFVDDPKAVLRTMETNRIGMKKSLFYQAYALYYEKMKKFDAADKIYHLGVQNLAEPANELQKSYEQFLHRMERNRNKKVQHQGRKTNSTSISAGRVLMHHEKVSACNENMSRSARHPAENFRNEYCPGAPPKFVNTDNLMDPLRSSKNEIAMKNTSNNHVATNSNHVGLLNDHLMKKVVASDSGVENGLRELKLKQDEKGKNCTDDTAVVKFVDTALVGNSNVEDTRHHGLVEPTINTKEAMNAIKSMFSEPLEPSEAGRRRVGNQSKIGLVEDARHHGLVEPTINTKEAMNAINSMFREPLEPSEAGRRRVRNQSKIGNTLNNEFKVFTDESLKDEVRSSGHNSSKDPSTQKHKSSDANQPLDEPFEIFIDGEETNEIEERVDHKGIQAQKSGGVTVSNSHEKALVFAKPEDLPSKCFKDPNPRSAYKAGLREDTVVHRFVGSTISDEIEVENVWHHGLVDPTINFKEAMNDINSMFGKPIEYARKSRSKKQNSARDLKNNSEEFLIYPDDESANQKAKDGIHCISQKPSSFARKSSLRKQDEVPDMMKNTGFLILPDDDLDSQQDSSLPGSSTENASGLFEQTLCTKEAMDEINKLFTMPMDF